MSDIIVWCEPVHRRELRLAEGDIARAVNFFQEKTGKATRSITLHPKNERFASEVPGGVMVNYVGGCLAWEIWLSADASANKDTGRLPRLTAGLKQQIGEIPPETVLLPMTPESNKTSATPELKHPEKIKVKRPEKNKGGRPKKDIPLARIAELKAEGMGVKSIARQLQLEGVDITAMTISRKLKEC